MRLDQLIQERWEVISWYGKENAYYIRDPKTGTSHEDVSPEAMDVRAALIERAPRLLGLAYRAFVNKEVLEKMPVLLRQDLETIFREIEKCLTKRTST